MEMYQAEFIKDYSFPDSPEYVLLTGCKSEWFTDGAHRILFEDEYDFNFKKRMFSKGFNKHEALIFDFDLEVMKKLQEQGYVILRVKTL